MIIIIIIIVAVVLLPITRQFSMYNMHKCINHTWNEITQILLMA